MIEFYLSKEKKEGILLVIYLNNINRFLREGFTSYPHTESNLFIEFSNNEVPVLILF